MFKKDEIIKLLNKLIGNIEPIGDSAVDMLAKENLEVLIAIAKELNLKINDIATIQDSKLASVIEVTNIANDYLDWLSLWNLTINGKKIWK